MFVFCLPCVTLHVSALFFPGYVVESRPVSGYKIEKKGKHRDWQPVNEEPVDDTTFKVPKLTEGMEYEFRVSAVNDAGPGKPSKATQPHKVRDPICKCLIYMNIY